MKTTSTAAWPVLKRYDRNHLARIAMPLGGIGTGTVSLGGRGDLRDWEIMNRPAKGNRGPAAFFTLISFTVLPYLVIYPGVALFLLRPGAQAATAKEPAAEKAE